MARGKRFPHWAAWKAGACALLLLAISSVGATPGDPLGPVQRVGNPPHTAETGLQLARPASGAYAATWFDSGYGLVPSGVYARAFSADGQPRGPAFLVDPTRDPSGNGPMIAMDAGGRFLVAWSIRNAVMGRHFAEDGAPMGAAFQLAARTPIGPVDHWDLAMAPDGRYVLLMERTLSAPLRLTTITLHRFDAGGRARLSLPALIRTDYALWAQGDQPEPYQTLARLHTPAKLALDERGEVVLAWLTESYASHTPQYPIFGPQFRRYVGSVELMRIGPGGLPLSGVVQVASFQSDNVRLVDFPFPGPRIARAPDGRIAVAWMQPGEGLKLQRYTSTLKPAGPAVLVAAPAQQRQPFDLELAGDGKAVVAWTEAQNPALPAGLKRVHAQLYSDTNQPLGGQISGPGNTTDSYQQPRLAMDALGNFVLGWQALLRPPGLQGENVGLLQRYSGL